MKKLFLLFFIFAAIQFANAQTPQAINYQAVARDASGKELPDGAKINTRISILDGNNTVYSEKHNNLNTKLGLYNFLIGKGLSNDDFSKIDWSSVNTKNIKIETDIDNNGTYDLESTTQLVSIPYALFAKAVQEKQTLKIVGSKLLILDASGKEVNSVNLPGANYFAGTGIAIVDGSIINTMPDKIVKITGAGGTEVTGNYPNFTVNSPIYIAGAGIIFIPQGDAFRIEANQKLAIDGDSLRLLPNGNAVKLPSNGGSSYTAGTNIGISATNVISATPSLSITGGNKLAISGGNTVTLPSGNTYTAGNNVGISAANVISSNATLTILGDKLSISGGNTITLPSSGGNQWKYEPSNFRYYFTNGTTNAIKGVDMHVDNGIITTDGTNTFSYLGKSSVYNLGVLSLVNEKGTSNIFAGYLSGFPNNGAITTYITEGTTAKQKTLMGVSSNGTGVIALWGKANAAPQTTTVVIGSDPDSNPNSLNAGVVRTYGPAGQILNTMGYLIDHPENGFLSVNGNSTSNVPNIGILSNSSNKPQFFMADGIFTDASITVNSFGTADFFCNGLKQFRVTHPLYPEKDIRYTCIEGPEAAMYVRGTVKLVNGKASVELPEHFRLLAGNKNVTVIVTPLSADSEGLAVIKKSKDGIEIVELKRGTGNYEVDYEVKAVRSTYEDNYQVIGDREKAPQMGGFSKQYISELNNAKVEQK